MNALKNRKMSAFIVTFSIFSMHEMPSHRQRLSDNLALGTLALVLGCTLRPAFACFGGIAETEQVDPVQQQQTGLHPHSGNDQLVQKALDDVFCWREKMLADEREKLEKCAKREDQIEKALNRREHSMEKWANGIAHRKASLLNGQERGENRRVAETIRRALHPEDRGLDRRQMFQRRHEPCTEPILVARYSLKKHTPLLHKIGVYHAGVLVCGIEIHFHRTGVEYRRPMESFNDSFSGRFIGYDAVRKLGGSNQPVRTDRSLAQVVAIVERMAESTFNRDNYAFLTHNCMLFARNLVAALLPPNTSFDFHPWPLHLIKMANGLRSRKGN